MPFNQILFKKNKWFYSGVIAVAGVVFYMVIQPIYADWRNLNKSISIKERKLLKNLKILSQKEEIAMLYNKYAGHIKMKGSVEEETALILKEIESAAAASNAHITDIKPHKVNDMDFYKEYYIELEAEGTMPNLAKFVYNLQGSKQMLKVRHLRLNAKGGETDILKAYMIVTKVLIP